MTDETRVLVVTTNPSLVIGLTFAGQDYDVDSQPELAGAVDADVVVLDVEDVEVHAAIASLGDGRPPVLVITEGQWDDLPEDVAAVPRPFTLDDLVERIERSVDGEAGGDGSTGGQGGSPGGDEGDPGPDGPEVAVIDLTQEEPAASAEKEPALAPVGTLPGEATALGAVDAQEPAEAPDAAAPSAAEPLPAQVRQVVTRPANDPAHSAGHPGGRRARWFARRAPGQELAQQDLRTRLAHTLTAANELERLCEDLPLLRSRHRLAGGIVGDVAQQLHADSVGFWRRPAAGEGWELVAHLGMTAHGATLIVPPDQPLFHEVEATGGGMLIDPVDVLQAAVAGIGGAHTASFMAAAVAMGPGHFGIIAVGRNEALDGDDLDVLVEIAQEAAPGLAVAEQLERLAELSEAERDAID